MDNSWDKTLDPQSRATIAYLRSPRAIRQRCGQIFQLANDDQLHHFACDLTQLEPVADYVIQVTRNQYPDLNIPYHSRWRHFAVGNIPRLARLEQALAGPTPLERAQSKFDLVITSVLLDAGAGGTWQYFEPGTGQVWQRSEGLAVASFHFFCQGGLSSNPHQPYQVDAQRLQALTESDLMTGFQVSANNPMVGISGRLQLLQRLGRSLLAHPQLFGSSSPDMELRPGNLVHYLLNQAPEKKLAASTVLEAVLVGLSDIWPGCRIIADTNLGDVWPHPGLQGEGLGKLIPFHKLSQWLTYSLIEPLQELGLEITGLDVLTGLPEYRNGGLCLDLGLLKPKHAEILQGKHFPGSDMIVEWRALTVILLDQIAEQVRQQLGRTAQDLPLVKVLQGGTWAAGRQIAKTLRPAGEPPIQLESDGTVF